MVAHNGGAYLPAVLSALAEQTRCADYVLAADAGSTDNSGELLRENLGERNVISLDGRKGYGAGVDAVLKHQSLERARLVTTGRQNHAGTAAASGATGSAASSPETDSSDSSNSGGSAVAVVETRTSSADEWIWLLQDDAVPAPDALQLLLEATERATTATVVGCKQLDWENHRRLVDVGLWTNQWFDRFSLVGLDEQDQGQYDDRADMFAVNTAGMLVRRDVFEKLGGFDPALPGPGDDLDFCARVRLAGDRVLIVPNARMFHVVNRPNGMGSAVAARKAGIFLRLKHAQAWAVPFLAIGTFFAAIYWLIAGFVLKAPGHALRMFAATCAGIVRPITLHRSRKALAGQRRKPRSVHKGLLVDGRVARAHLKMLRESVGPDEEIEENALNGPSILEPTGEAHQETVAPLAAIKTAPIVSALALTALLVILSLSVLSRFLGVSALSGGAMLPLSEQLGQVWQNATGWWVSLGSGLPGRGNPFNFVLTLLSSGGNGSVAVLWLVLLALPLSGITAWLGVGALTLQRWPRIVGALAWAGAPVLLVAMGQGRVGALVAHVLIPLVMLGLIRAVGGAVAPAVAAVIIPGATASSGTGAISKMGRPGIDGNPSWTAAAASGLALAVVSAASPSLLPVAVLGILTAALLLGRRGRTIWWALVPSAALFAPFIWSAWGNPRALLADPGVPLATNPGPLWQQLLGFPQTLDASSGLVGLSAFASAPWWTWVAVFIIGAPVVVAAVAALLFPLRRGSTVRTLWVVALLALAAAYAGKFIAVAFDGVTLVTPYNGPAISLAFFALLGAAMLGFDALHRRAWDPSYRSVDSSLRLQGGKSKRATERGVLEPARPAGKGSEQHRIARGMAVTLSVLLVGAPLASLGLWGVQQATGEYNASALTGPFLPQAVTAGTIPATAADRGAGPEASRTIVMSVKPEGGVQATLMQGSGTTLDDLSSIASAARITGDLGSEVVLESDAATTALADSVAAMVSKSGLDPRAGLVELGVGFVVLRQGDTAAELLAGELEAVPGLATVGPTESGWLWRVKPNYKTAGLTDVVNRVRLVDAQGAAVAPVDSQGQNVATDIPAGESERRVVLAERSDPGWQAWLDGKQLKAVTAGWAQAFELPQTQGYLEIRYVHPMSAVMALVQLVLFGLTLLLALPVRARRGRTGAYRDEASLQKVGRGA
ncbi:glycosyltransferase family 2 protein [Arthrobacter sp. TMP15]|uniref:glycosyltransferase family 2 protein n=1 Tax=Arthrobacter sp. TMP15 TaxID=3140789 RepID=UPI0031BBB6F6